MNALIWLVWFPASLAVLVFGTRAVYRDLKEHLSAVSIDNQAD